jgi:hypothetical protein
MSEIFQSRNSQTLIPSLNRVKSLSNILRDLEDVLPQRNLSDQQKADGLDLTRGCSSILSGLEKIVDKYHGLDTSPKSLGDKSRRLWKRLKWEPDDITELRSRLTSNITLLNAFNGSLTK